jgi:hypothetical protein
MRLTASVCGLVYLLVGGCGSSLEGYDGSPDDQPAEEPEHEPAEEEEIDGEDSRPQDDDDASDDSTDPDPGDDDPQDPDDTDTDPVEDIECGPNSIEAGDSCECLEPYTWCAEGDYELGCCAWDIDTFTVTMVSANVYPYADDDQTPWDWDGGVPSWVVDLVVILAEYEEDAADWFDYLAAVEEWAPELLAGTVPPDVYVTYEIDEETYWTSSTEDDTIEPYWAEDETVTLDARTDLTIWWMDEDLTWDDTIEGAVLTLDDMQWLAGLGDITFTGSYGLYDFTLAIEPVY